MLKETNVPVMNKAVQVIYDMSEDTRIREMARLREKTLHDEVSALANAKKEGIEQGQKMEREKIAEFLRSKGMSEELIRDMLQQSES